MRLRGLAVSLLLLASGIFAGWWFSGAGPAWYLHRMSTRDLVLRSLQDPGNNRLQLLLGQRMEAAHQWDSAAAAYLQAATDSSMAANALAGLARVYLAEGKLSLASRAAEQALTARSPSGRPVTAALRAAAQVALQQGNWLLARDRFQALTRRSARDGGAWEGLARSELEIHSPLLARQAADKAAAILPHTAELDTLRGRIALEAGAPADAAPLLKEAVQRTPSDPQAWTYLGEALMASGDIPSAESALKRAQKLAPLAPPPVSDLARLFEGEGKNAGAIAMYRQVLRLDPGSEAALYHLSQLLETTGQATDAMRVRKEFVRTSDYHRTVVELQNRISRLVSDRSGRHPELPGLYRRLGLLHFENQDWMDAVRVLSRARDLLPKDASVQIAYQSALHRLQSGEAARQDASDSATAG